MIRGGVVVWMVLSSGMDMVLLVSILSRNVLNSSSVWLILSMSRIDGLRSRVCRIGWVMRKRWL